MRVLGRFAFDTRVAARGLWRDRAFSLAAMAMLAIALGLNTTVFAIMDAMLFRGYPLVKENERLVYLQERGPSRACCISYLDFEDWRAEARSFEGLVFVGERGISFRDGDGRPSDMRVTAVSANTFSLLGVAPALGRDFIAADELPGAGPVVMLNHRFWASRFGSRPDVVGQTVSIDGVTATVIGVMPQRFDFPLQIADDMWVPIRLEPQQRQRHVTDRGFLAAGRLRAGVSRDEARAELETINRRLEAAYPESNRGMVPTLASHPEINSGRDAALIWGSLWAASWLVWLIACANVTNLTLVRTIARGRELATRMALGASRGRLVRQLALENLLVTAIAAVLAWWLTNWTVGHWVAVTASLYQVLDYTIDARTFAYLAAISAAAAVVCAVAPIARIAQLGVSGALKGEARGTTQGLQAKRLAGGLVIAQVALAVVLIAGAGVLVRSFLAIVGADSGVRGPGTILVGSVRPPSDKYPTPEARRAYFDRVEARLDAIPGLAAKTLASVLPVSVAGLRPIEVEGRAISPDEDEPVGFVLAGASYFDVVGRQVVDGRAFTGDDRGGSVPVAVINQSLADRYWPGERPVGRRIRAKVPNGVADWRTIVGVVPNILQGDPLRQRFNPLIYVPFQQEPAPARTYFLARTAGPPTAVAGAVRAAIAGIDGDVTLERFGTLEASFAFDRDFMDAEHSELGKHAKVSPVFAAIAWLLAGIGLYAVLSHSMRQRTKEIGVRIAIGASSRDIRWLITSEGLRPVAVGLTVGVLLSIGVNRLLQSQLVGVSPYDPLTLAAAPSLLVLVAVLACRVPARRAMQVDPLVALRHE
jgi:predicted permease